MTKRRRRTADVVEMADAGMTGGVPGPNCLNPPTAPGPVAWGRAPSRGPRPVFFDRAPHLHHPHHIATPLPLTIQPPAPPPPPPPSLQPQPPKSRCQRVGHCRGGIMSGLPTSRGFLNPPPSSPTQCVGNAPCPPPRDALEGKGPQRRPQKRLGRRLEEVSKAVGAGYCRLPMPLKPALAVKETVAGHRLDALGGTSPPCPPAHPFRAEKPLLKR